jgi:hypothetical protein
MQVPPPVLTPHRPPITINDALDSEKMVATF